MDRQVDIFNGYRTIFCFLVVVFHTNDFFQPLVADLQFYQYLKRMYWCIDTFFMMSGWLNGAIFNAFLSKMSFWKSCSLFFFRKFIKFAPIYYIIVAIVAYNKKFKSYKELIPVLFFYENIVNKRLLYVGVWFI